MKSHRFCLSAALFSLALFAVSCTKESLSEETILPEKPVVKKSAEASYHQPDATDAPDTDSGADYIIKKATAANFLDQSEVTDHPTLVDPLKKTAEAAFQKQNSGAAVSDSPFASTGGHFRQKSAAPNVAATKSQKVVQSNMEKWNEDEIIADPAYPKNVVMQSEKLTGERQ